MSRFTQWLFRGTPSSRRPAFRPRIEALENREVPAFLFLFSDGTANYLAGNGVVNDLSVAVNAGGYQITDTENITVINAGNLPGVSVLSQNSVRFATASINQLNISLGDRNDRINIAGAVNPIAVDMGAGDDVAFIGSPTAGLDPIQSPVRIFGGTNGPAGDHIDLVDSATSTAPRDYVVRPDRIAFVSSVVRHSGVEFFNVEAGPGDDQFSVLGTAVSTQTRLDGNSGSDAFVVGDGFLGLQDVRGEVSLIGGVTSFRDQNSLVVNDDSPINTTGHTYFVQADSILRDHAGRILMPDIDFRTTTLNASNGADNISVRSTGGSNRGLNVNGDGGSDTIRLRMAGVIEGSTMNFDGGTAPARLIDRFIIDDFNSTTGRSYTVDDNRVFFTLSNETGVHPPTSASFSRFVQMNLNAGNGADEIQLAHISGSMSLAVNAGGGNDVISFNLSSEFGLFGRISVNGGIGSDWLNYSGTDFGVTVNLATGTATGATGGIAGIENVIGSEFADTLTGDSRNNILSGLGGDDVLDGGRGRDVLIGGDGADSATGGIGDDIVIGDNLAGQSDPHTMQSIMDIWAQSLTFQTRQAQLQGQINSTTVTDDGAHDILSGGFGTNLVVADLTV
jgi:hypothetical protein